MNEIETFNAILATAIANAQAAGRSPSPAAEEAAKAYATGLAAFAGATPSASPQ